ncbi:GNAT family N-acetyltransferase [Rossellomorea aquimaris]|uniref:GNAT family N-acetyltransferase n=1 Tax=Rossellomorea aquimaris TaxID=189382 RepID=UPI001CD679EA|nr:GNAT family N-acetyltransferase [Rossellomorea aquimaris]MCA1057667.1 GNAT family N-acetyltransferase [Rossellomorea aquimaris]
MEVLEKNEFQKVLTILDNCETCPTFAYAVIENIIEGTVRADRADCPATVLIGTNSGIYFIVGNEQNSAFNRSFRDFHQQNKGFRFTLFSATKQWDEVICSLFENEITQLSRYVHLFNKEKFSTEVKELSADYIVKETDNDMILRSPEFNQDYYILYWGSVSNFLTNGMGFSALYKGRVVSECTSIFHSKSIVEIDIATQQDFIGKGLAFNLGKLFIDECLEKGLTPHWDCDVENVSSIKLAEKLGFEHPIRYSLFVRK